MRHSGLQRSVLALYRSCLREARKKPKVERLVLGSPILEFTKVTLIEYSKTLRDVCPVCVFRFFLQ